MSQELELYICPLAGGQTLPFLDFENIGILHDAVDVDCALEARLHPAVGVVQHVDVCLKLPAFVAGLVHLELRREKHSSLAKRKSAIYYDEHSLLTYIATKIRMQTICVLLLCNTTHICTSTVIYENFVVKKFISHKMTNFFYVKVLIVD